MKPEVFDKIYDKAEQSEKCRIFMSILHFILPEAAAQAISVTVPINKTHIDITEKGSKAGAATIVFLNDGGSSAEVEITPQHRVILNRPFLYMIADAEFILRRAAGIFAGFYDQRAGVAQRAFSSLQRFFYKLCCRQMFIMNLLDKIRAL